MNNKWLAILIVFVLILNLVGLFDSINNTIYDNYIIANQQTTVNPDIAIIEIDSKSVKEIGYWPWSRSIHTRLISKVIEASPKVIGINLSFPVTQGNVSEDEELYEVLKSFPNIVLTTKFTYKKIKNISILYPDKDSFPEILKSHDFKEEKDIIRSFPPFKVLPAFSLIILRLYYRDTPDELKYLPTSLIELLELSAKIEYSTDQNVLIDYQRTPERFNRYSYVDVLEGKVDPDKLKDKIVLIGITDKYLTSFYSTPFTIDKREHTSPPVILQAQIIDGLMNLRNLRKYPPLVTIILSILIGILFYRLTKEKHFWLQGILFVASIAVIFIADFIIFKYNALWLPPVFSVVMVLTIFGSHIYFTVTSVDKGLVETISKLKTDENIPLMEVPIEVNDKVQTLNALMKALSSDRKTIKSIINSVKNGIIVVNSDGIIVWSNEYFLNIFKDDLVLNNHIEKVIEEISFEQMKAALARDESYKKEITYGQYHFNCYISETYTTEKHYVVILNDVSDLVKMNQLKTDVARILSHELKTPLLNITIATENIYDFEDRKIVLDSTDHITKYTELMTNIINNFLNLNKLENNLMDAHIVETDYLKTINNCIEIQKAPAEKRNIELELQCDEIGSVMIDEKLMEIVLNNLISNAVKYSNDNSKVKIKVEKDTQHVKTSIIDSGIGIPDEELEKIFEKFYRASNNEPEGIKGTGLGLSIVSKILHLHNSEIKVESKYNQGSTFSFDLPVKQPD